MKGVRAGVDVKLKRRGGVAWVEFPAFAAGGRILHAVSTREGGACGDLNTRFGPKDSVRRTMENRTLLAKALGVDVGRLTTVRQVHGVAVSVVTASDAGRGAGEPSPVEADAIVTNAPNVPLLIQTADCMPVLLSDPVKGVVGLAHAGWRGTVKGVAVKALETMRDACGSDPADVRVAFGPAIGGCCYEVDDTVRADFMAAFKWGPEVFRPGFGGKWHLDLEEANARQLRDAGVPEDQMVRPSLCTVDNGELFFSHRLEAAVQGETGRFATIVMLRKK